MQCAKRRMLLVGRQLKAVGDHWSVALSCRLRKFSCGVYRKVSNLTADKLAQVFFHSQHV